MLVFVKGGKLEKPEGPSGRGESQQQTQPTNGTGPELNRCHIVRRCVLSPLPYYCSLLATGQENGKHDLACTNKLINYCQNVENPCHN